MRAAPALPFRPPVSFAAHTIIQLHVTPAERRVLRIILRQPAAGKAREAARTLLLCQRLSKRDADVTYAEAAQATDHTAAQVQELCEQFRYLGLRALMADLAEASAEPVAPARDDTAQA